MMKDLSISKAAPSSDTTGYAVAVEYAQKHSAENDVRALVSAVYEPNQDNPLIATRTGYIAHTDGADGLPEYTVACSIWLRGSYIWGANEPETIHTSGGEAPSFVIDTEEKAVWALKKIAAVEAEKELVKAQAAQRIAELDADNRALRAKFEGQLEAWAQVEAERRKRKTITTLGGTLTLRHMAGRFTVADGQAAMEYAQVNVQGAVVETTTVTLDKAAYIEAAESTGETLPGLEFVPARESFAIRFGKEKEATNG